MLTVAILRERGLEEELKLGYPSVRVLRTSTVTNTVRAIRQGSLDLLIVRASRVRGTSLFKIRMLARAAAHYHVAGIIVVSTLHEYTEIRSAIRAFPMVEIALGSSEIRPIARILLARTLRGWRLWSAL